MKIPDLQRTFHVFPFSIGAETNGSFSYANLIMEAGYTPWYYQPNNDIPELLKKVKAGFFLQTGYKFVVDTSNAKVTGGAKDESNEMLNKTILRAKLVFDIDTKNLMQNQSGFGIGLIGSTNLWYDLVNSKVYHKLAGKARLYLNKNYYFDFIYEKGSGAPNFNQGAQFGASLGVTF